MSDSEGMEYLQPGFDPKSLTIPRLRSILVAHNIPYSSSAKKGQLIDIFNDQVVPQSKKILAARARAKRSSKGITDADSQSSSNPFDETEPEPESLPSPVASTRRSRSPKKASARIKSEEPDYTQPMPPPAPSTSKRKSRASSRHLASDTETGSEIDGGASLRITRKAKGAPQFKTEESDGFFRRTSDVFTRDNPFQSGSSPSAAEPTPTNRRRTTGPAKARSSSRGVRRQTESPAFPDDDVDDAPIVSSTFEAPTAHVARHRTPEPPTVEAGEEFTPEEQLELNAEQAVNGETAIVPARQTGNTSKISWGTPVSVLLVTLLGIYAGWYRQEKIAVGYCGMGQSGSSIPSDFDVPEWAHSILPAQINTPQPIIDTLEPECEPCPSHAYCYSDYSVRCEQDYILKPHPLSLGGIIPLPPTCEPDGEKVKRVQVVADRAIEELRERTAKYECRDPVDEQGSKLESPAIEEQELKQMINKKRSKKLSNQEFEDLWGSAIGEIKGREEVEVEVKEASDSSGVRDTLLISTSLARVPITCAIKRSIWLGLARYRFQISLLIALIGTAAYARSAFLSDRAAAAQVPALVDLVLERLSNQKQVDEEFDDPFLFLPNLRDDVLRSVHSLSQRDKIWTRVKAVVEQNSNVRTGQREGHSGEVGKAWEWIGPTAGGSNKRRKSGRVSWGAGVKGDDSPVDEDKSYLHQKWEDPTPVY
ncbi:Uu.00g044230.m01.CDS01 [Anthostomella pinea]|uniref:Uu.00g044230.m01.CDS01 n=1 Tax=Anthostomella pinea TaxID=933095 RepID=A0AAI8YEA0_9PEZI|nr:Uu.00g044230.m01.CDS01 [Anthostomella pinea]